MLKWVKTFPKPLQTSAVTSFIILSHRIIWRSAFYKMAYCKNNWKDTLFWHISPHAPKPGRIPGCSSWAELIIWCTKYKKMMIWEILLFLSKDKKWHELSSHLEDVNNNISQMLHVCKCTRWHWENNSSLVSHSVTSFPSS